MIFDNFKYIFLALIAVSSVCFGQEDADDLLDDMLNDGPNYTSSAYKASRIINTHSIKQPEAGEMEFRISHRFGRMNQGAYALWGLDQATIHFSLEYNPIERLTIGLGRSSYLKTYDGFAKFSLLKQQTGQRNIPLFLTYFSSFEWKTLKNEIPNYEWYHNINFTQQLLIARKFSKRLTLQLTPTLVHKNLVENANMYNNIFAVGFGGRYKITQHMSINVDSYWVNHGPMPEGVQYYMPFAIGVDLETGGHVFQIMVSNSLPMREAAFITETTGDFWKGDIHLGFNISRMFHLHN